MTNRSGRTRAKTISRRDELTWGMNSVVYHCVNKNGIAVADFFNKKRKFCNHRCPDSVYFITLLLIIYLSAIETLTCRRK